MKTKRGFTLIELLVVIAIIAILAALLFPVLAGQNKRRMPSPAPAICANGDSRSTMYLDDNSRIFPLAKIANGTPGAPGYNEEPSHWSDFAAFHAAGQGDGVWYNALPPYVGGQALWQIHCQRHRGFCEQQKDFQLPHRGRAAIGFAPIRTPSFSITA